MTHTVQQLLTLSRVQHQNASIDQQLIDVNQAVIAVIADMDHVAHEKRIDIELQGKDGIEINVNPQLFQVLLRNLLDNAIKYSPAGSLVRVKFYQMKNQVWLSVEDSGPGVVDNNYHRITQRFYRCVETAGTVEGSGLGLSIVQRIISLHAAEIAFDKADLGGLKVCLKFQLAEPDSKTVSLITS
jgi:two-component system, OmpR family, sensor histidine kinase QseC